MSESQVISKELFKKCMIEGCTLNEQYPEGVPEFFESCPVCKSNLLPIQNKTQLSPIVNISTQCDVTLETAQRSPEGFMITSQSSSLKVIFRTLMVESHFTSISGKLTIRFNGVMHDNLMEDTTCLKKIEVIEYHDHKYVILEGFIQIPEDNIRIVHVEGSFGIPYKYFLDGRREILRYMEMYHRCLYLDSRNINGVLYKYDFMPLPDNLSEEYTFLRTELNLWIISFRVFANFTHREDSFTFEEQVSTMKTISNNIFHSLFIHHSKVGNSIVYHKDCKDNPEIWSQKYDSVTQWIMRKISKTGSLQNLLRYLIFSLLLVYKRKLNDRYHYLFRKLLNLFNLDRIKHLIMKKAFFSENFQNKEQTIQNLRESFEAIIFNGPDSVTNERIVLQFLPLYHCLFQLVDQHNSLQKQQAMLDNEYWGFPANTDTIRFYNNQDVKHLELLLHMGQHVPILPYSIVLISLTEQNFDKLSSLGFK